MFRSCCWLHLLTAFLTDSTGWQNALYEQLVKWFSMANCQTGVKWKNSAVCIIDCQQWSRISKTNLACRAFTKCLTEKSWQRNMSSKKANVLWLNLNGKSAVISAWQQQNNATTHRWWLFKVGDPYHCIAWEEPTSTLATLNNAPLVVKSLLTTAA